MISVGVLLGCGNRLHSDYLQGYESAIEMVMGYSLELRLQVLGYFACPAASKFLNKNTTRQISWKSSKITFYGFTMTLLILNKSFVCVTIKLREYN